MTPRDEPEASPLGEVEPMKPHRDETERYRVMRFEETGYRDIRD